MSLGPVWICDSPWVKCVTQVPTSRMPVTTASAAVHITPGNLLLLSQGSSNLTPNGEIQWLSRLSLNITRSRGRNMPMETPTKWPPTISSLTSEFTDFFDSSLPPRSLTEQ